MDALAGHDQYASYLLRLKRMRNGSRATWVVSVQSTAGGEQRWFPNLEALLTFLRAEFGGCEELGDTDQLES